MAINGLRSYASSPNPVSRVARRRFLRGGSALGAARRTAARRAAHAHGEEGRHPLGSRQPVSRRRVPLARDLPAQHRQDRRPALDLSRRDPQAARRQLDDGHGALAGRSVRRQRHGSQQSRRRATSAAAAPHDRLQSRRQYHRAKGARVAQPQGEDRGRAARRIPRIAVRLVSGRSG